MKHHVVWGIKKRSRGRAQSGKAQTEECSMEARINRAIFLNIRNFLGMKTTLQVKVGRLAQGYRMWTGREKAELSATPSHLEPVLWNPNAQMHQDLHSPASRGAGVVLRSVEVWLDRPGWATRTDDRSKGRGCWSTASVYDTAGQIQVCHLERRGQK